MSSREEPRRGLLDTSVLIASEDGRPLDESKLPDEAAISTVTIAELHVGVLAAADLATRARRLTTLEAVSDIATLPIDDEVAARWAMLRVAVAEADRRVNVNDLWIAATALVHDLPVVTQDGDFETIAELGGPQTLLV